MDVGHLVSTERTTHAPKLIAVRDLNERRDTPPSPKLIAVRDLNEDATRRQSVADWIPIVQARE